MWVVHGTSPHTVGFVNLTQPYASGLVTEGVGVRYDKRMNECFVCLFVLFLAEACSGLM